MRSSSSAAREPTRGSTSTYVRWQPPSARFHTRLSAASARESNDNTPRHALALRSAMKPPKVLFVCQECGAQAPKWMGRCLECGAWNSLTEERAPDAGAAGVH